MWQVLRDELRPQGLEIVSVALDVDLEAARPYVDAAAVDFPTLIDRGHLVDELFGIVNVPSSVWIDEQGTIVRPVETSAVRRKGIDEGLKDPRTFDPSIPRAGQGMKRDPELYRAALRDWAAKGAESEWTLPPEDVIARSTPRSQDAGRAAAHFELGVHLHRAGHIEAAQGHWRVAHRLAPDNWTYRRQAWELIDPGVQGRSDIYDSSWVDDIRKIGPENYYPPLRR